MVPNNLIKIVIFLVILIIGCRYYYNYSDKPIVTIHPEEVPTKIKPQNAGGLTLQSTNHTIYENLGSRKSMIQRSNLLPEPEQPISLNDKIIDPIDDLIANLAADDPKEPFDLINRDEPTTSDNVNTTAAKGLNIIKITKKKDTQQNSHEPQNGNKNNYKIQLASAKSESQALLEGERIKKIHHKILGDTNITYEKISHDNGKFFYLILAGDYNTFSQAKAVCKKLSANQQSCIITK